MNTLLKLPNVAGAFYDSDPVRLKDLLQKFFAASVVTLPGYPCMLIAPHAGYIYSGPVAAIAYKLWQQLGEDAQEIVILSPTHYCHLSSIASLPHTAYHTPLGDIPVNTELVEKLVKQKLIEIRPEVFEQEHALEVHLPFLQIIFKKFSILPLIVGQVDASEVVQLLESLDNGKRLFVISTDLSHFLTSEQARKVDLETANLIEKFDGHRLKPNMACGYYPLRGVLEYARAHAMAIKKLDLRNSSDTGGGPERVVGYGAFAIYPKEDSEKTMASKI